MNRFQKWLFRKLIKEAIRTDSGHRTLFRMIWLESKSRFHEDNAPTRLEYLQEHLDAQYKEELLLAEKYRTTISYINIHNSNSERVYRYGEISRPVD